MQSGQYWSSDLHLQTFLPITNMVLWYVIIVFGLIFIQPFFGENMARDGVLRRGFESGEGKKFAARRDANDS